MRLDIDWTRCDGHGLCARLLPEQVHLDEWGFPVITTPEVAEPMAQHARRAVAACPQLALRLTTGPPRGRG